LTLKYTTGLVFYRKWSTTRFMYVCMYVSLTECTSLVWFSVVDKAGLLSICTIKHSVS